MTASADGKRRLQAQTAVGAGVMSMSMADSLSSLRGTKQSGALCFPECFVPRNDGGRQEQGKDKGREQDKDKETTNKQQEANIFFKQ
jgi:hypothetical protein